jgi:drug/metabolite transporter (DMT)-like permease
MQITLATSRRAAHLQLLGMAFLWGASWPLGKALSQQMPPLAAASWRFTMASVMLVLWLGMKTRRFPDLRPRQWAALLAGGAFGVFGYGVFFMLGLSLVEAGRASLVVTINPVFTTLMAAWLFHETFNWRVALGMVVSVMGAAYVLTHGAPLALLQGEIGVGEWLLLGCIACWVIYSLLGKRSMQGIDSLTVTTITACIGTALLWMATLAFESPPRITTLPLQTIGLLLVMALGPTVLAYAWYFEGISKLGAGTASSYISLVPVFGVLMSTWFLGEAVDGALALGGALAVAGLVIMNLARR